MKTSIKFDVSTDSELLSISGSVQPKLNAKNDRTVDLDQNTPKQSEVNKKNKNGSNVLKIGNWNIKRDLVTKEIELCDMIKKENFDILFLNENIIRLDALIVIL